MSTDTPTKQIDYLTEDDPLSNQKWCCVSFLSPEGVKNCKIRGFKVRGVFDTKEEADERAAFLQKLDPDFNIFIGEVGKWLHFAPDPYSKEAGNMVYAEKKLNELAKSHKENLKKQKIVEAERKQAMFDKSVQEEKQRNASGSKTHDRLRKKLEERKASSSKANFISSDPTDDEIEHTVAVAKEESKRLNTVRNDINTKEEEIKSLDDNLAKIQKLYEKMKNAS